MTRRSTTVCFCLALVCLLALSPGSAAAEDSGGELGTAGRDGDAENCRFVVVMADGRVVESQIKPVSAFGQVRYRDAAGRSRTVPADRVDLQATRERNAAADDHTSGGTLSVSGVEGVPVLDEDASATEPTPGPTSVTVYSATWCPHCKPAKQYIASKGVRAKVIEVDRLPAEQQERARATMRRLTGKVSFPTIVINGRARTGFSRSWIDKQLGDRPEA